MSLFSFWRRHYRDIPRIRQIIAVLSRHGFGHLVERMGLQRFISVGRRLITFKRGPASEHRLNAPERFRMVFEELGPSFIKLGQVLACRPDMLPIEYAKEFCKLTDSVSPFPFADARRIIESERNASLHTLFSEFAPVPVAAASIAQVHRARLIDGTEVMVKVQRPDIEDSIERDISILRGLADLVQEHIPEMAVYNPRGVVEEFSRSIRKELDFYIEASNAQQMRSNFAKSDLLYVPKIHAALSGKRVLVLELLEGIRIDEFERLEQAGFHRSELSRKGAEVFFQMVFQDGFFHADPHPGNIFVLPDGRLGLVDFGIMGRVTEENMQYFADTFVALAEHDFERLVQQYINIGFVPEETVNIEKFQRELREELAEFLEPYYGMTATQIDFVSYVDRLTQMSIRYGLRMPQTLYLVNKTLLTMEGLLRQLDPDFNFVQVATPYVTRLIRRRKDPRRAFRALRKNVSDLYDLASVAPKQAQSLFRKMLRGEVRFRVQHEDLHHLIRDLDRSSNRIAFSLITAAVIVASSIIIHAGAGPRLFDIPVFGLIGYVIAGLFGLWIMIGIFRSGQL